MLSVYLVENMNTHMVYLTTPEQWLFPQVRKNVPYARLKVLKAILLKIQVF